MKDDPDHWEAFADDPDDDYLDEDEGERCRAFIGHGRSLHWHVIERFLEKELDVDTVEFGSESRTGKHNVEVLEEMLGTSDIAIIVMTAEDLTEDGSARARQNVVHEAGLAQSHFGRERTVLLVQRGVELPSNLAGVQVLPFSGDSIEQCFEGLRRVLEREELI